MILREVKYLNPKPIHCVAWRGEGFKLLIIPESLNFAAAFDYMKVNMKTNVAWTEFPLRL